MITVVVPIYNVDNFLDHCIASIVGQTYRDLQIILVDDGSTDRSPKICDEWAKKDERIKVIHKENAGLGMARNTGIEHAVGEYICFVDSDDYIDPEMVEKAYVTASGKKADIVVYGMSTVNERRELMKCFVPTSEKYYCGSDVQERFLPDLIDCRHKNACIQNVFLSACTCLISMELVKKTKWRFVSERIIISEDSYALIELYKHVNRVAVLPESLYFCCERMKSLTRTYREDRFEKITHFYSICYAMADRLGYGEAVHTSISALFLSFSIAAMKQIAESRSTRREKKMRLVRIMNDSAIRASIDETKHRDYGWERRVLVFVMRYRLYGMCLLLLNMKNLVQNNRFVLRLRYGLGIS